MIKARDLHIKFDKKGIAGLGGVSFEVSEGKVLGIMGPNGSGKTTLLKVLSGEIQAESGNAQVPKEISIFRSPKEVPSLNVQKFLIDSVTLNIEPEKKIQLARDLADTFEFTFQLRQNLDEVSMGQRQKILLAKDIINRPSIVFMDEPFTHLDPFMREGILADFFQYIRSQKMTVIWVTHDLDEALKFSDEVAVMNFGKFEQLTTPDELMKAPRNLFVAKFLGYRNFFPVKEVLGNWATPWGEIPKKEEFQEGILVVPDAAWIYGEGPKMEMTHQTVTRQSYLSTYRFNEKDIYVQRPIHQLVPDNNSQLSPDFASSFVIPL